MENKCIFVIYPNLDGIQKNGTYKYEYTFKNKNIYRKNCLLKNKLFFYEGNILLKNDLIKETYIDKNEEMIKAYKIQYYILYKLHYKLTSFRTPEIQYYFIHKEKNFDKVVKYMYTLYFIIKKNFSNDSYTRNKTIFIKFMAVEYYLFKLKFNVSDNYFFIAIFYKYYIYLIRDEIIKKYGVDLISLNFENYHKVYLFLKEKKYVSLFYTKIKKEIIEEYNNFKIEMKDKQKEINKFGKSLKTAFIIEADYLKNLNIDKKTMTAINKKIKTLQNNEN